MVKNKNMVAYDIVNSLESGVLIVDENLNFIFMNNRGYKILEIESEEELMVGFPQHLYQFGMHNFLSGFKNSLIEKIVVNEKELMVHVTKIENEDFSGALIDFNSLDTCKGYIKHAKHELEALSLLNTIMDATNECIVYVNKEGIIELLSRAYAEFLNVKVEEMVGRHVREVIENTRMDIVIKTGKPEIAQVQEIHGKKMIATRIPVFVNGKATGAVGKVLFRDIEELNQLYIKINSIEKELNLYRDEFKKLNKARYALDSIICENIDMKRLKEITQKVANTNSNVLILGDSGTGKELFAHAIHNNSKRRQAPFIKVNCGAIPFDLVESEFFGYEEGSFTGAKKGGKIGKFKAADGGTIFLDEIAELPLNMQVKLLRVLQDREIEKIGSVESEKVDVRVVAATNKNLEEMVDKGTFRLDLYYRLNVVTLKIPPLKERKDDIPIISNYLIKKISTAENIYVEKISSKAMEFLMRYDWPGNVRELENILERAINFLDEDKKIMTKHLPTKITGMTGVESVKSLKDTMDKVEKEVLINSLILSKGNKTEAADALGISRTSFYDKIQKHGLMETLNSYQYQ
ncbi:MAG: sigma 54-interacting transcriptional regulator [Gudongella sp.]|nr:sigma 54-interacting transcriptional regulator [Gudongella sp.]